MEELLLKMFEQAKTDKEALRLLKLAAVRCQHFELACKLLELQKQVAENPLHSLTQTIKKMQASSTLLQTKEGQESLQEFNEAVVDFYLNLQGGYPAELIKG